MTALLLALFAQPTPLTARDCFERSVEGCLCEPETLILDWRTKALAYDELVAHPPSCSPVEAGAWSTAGVLLLQLLKAVLVPLWSRLRTDLEWEHAFCVVGKVGYHRPEYCLNPNAPIVTRLRRNYRGDSMPSPSASRRAMASGRLVTRP